MTSPDGTWLPLSDAALAAGISAKALRRRVERGTVDSELRSGRRFVRLESVTDAPAPAPGRPLAAPPVPLGELVERLEKQAEELGRLRALEEVSRSTAERMERELVQARAELKSSQARLAELEEAAASKGRWWRRRPAQQPNALISSSPARPSEGEQVQPQSA